MNKVRVEFLNSPAGLSGRPGEAFDVDIEDGKTVGDLLIDLSRNRPALAASVFDNHSQHIHGNVAVFHNGRQIELENGLRTTIKDDDILTFVPFLRGG